MRAGERKDDQVDNRRPRKRGRLNLDIEAAMIPRNTYLGERQGYTPDESCHLIECADCGGGIDCRDLGSVFDHEGPLPHLAQDQKQ